MDRPHLRVSVPGTPPPQWRPFHNHKDEGFAQGPLCEGTRPERGEPAPMLRLPRSPTNWGSRGQRHPSTQPRTAPPTMSTCQNLLRPTWFGKGLVGVWALVRHRLDILYFECAVRAATGPPTWPPSSQRTDLSSFGSGGSLTVACETRAEKNIPDFPNP